MSHRLSSLLAPVFGLLLLAMSSGQSQAQPCCGPITPSAQHVAALIDSSGLDHLWLASATEFVVWNTGEPDTEPQLRAPLGAKGFWSHCHAFAAAIAARAGIYLLRPPEHGMRQLATAQVSWLRSEGRSQGWRVLADYVEAQRAANRGDLVLEAFENTVDSLKSHMSIVRPSDKTRAELDRDGPQVAWAGWHNAYSTTTARTYLTNHAGAWIPGGGGGLQYFAHAINWSSVKQE